MTTLESIIASVEPSKEPAASAGVRVGVSLLVGVVSGIVVGMAGYWDYAVLLAWDVGAMVFLLWMWATLHGRTPHQTAALAMREDPGRAGSDILLVLASVVSLAAVGVLLFHANKLSGAAALVQTILGIISVFISWAVVHTVYTLRYARLYYKDQGGIDFYTNSAPCYADFMYIAFTIGMTFQVSDNNFTTTSFRKMALRHALVSYLFGTIIVASVINLLLSLGK